MAEIANHSRPEGTMYLAFAAVQTVSILEKRAIELACRLEEPNTKHTKVHKDGAKGDTSPHDRLVNALSDADEQLNQAYQLQLRNTPDVERRALRDAQRLWLAQRNRECEFTEKGLSDKTAWLNAAVSDPKRADCLIQQTIFRAAELFLQQTVQPQKSDGPVFFKEMKPALPESAYTARSKQTQKFGKFYFEVAIDHGNNKQSVEAAIELQVSDGKKIVSTTYNIRPQDLVIRLGDKDSITIEGGGGGTMRLPRTIIGVAIDLESRQFFSHRDGDWDGNPPSLGKGLEFSPGEEFFAEVVSSVSMAPLIKDKVLMVNFGRQPFAYPPPTGYVAFDDDPQTVDWPDRPPPYSIAEPGTSIAGEKMSAWIQRYWQWTRSFPRDETPSDDTTGARCNAGQTGPVFFLTGSSQGISVSRACSVPKEQYILIPLLNVMAQAQPPAQATCDDLLESVRQVNVSVEGLSLKINGQEIQSLTSFTGGSGCFELRDASRNVSGRAAGAGYWVVFAPLVEGDYEVRFSGRYRANGFAQDVLYQLHVE